MQRCFRFDALLAFLMLLSLGCGGANETNQTDAGSSTNETGTTDIRKGKPDIQHVTFYLPKMNKRLKIM